mgnify:CR=1 FL=1
MARQNGSLAKSDKAGNILFALALLACVWFFSVPPEIRRTKICTTDPALAVRVRTECVTPGEWATLVRRHYSSCRGLECVHFDFTVDPATLEFNAKVVEYLRGHEPQ